MTIHVLFLALLLDNKMKTGTLNKTKKQKGGRDLLPCGYDNSLKKPISQVLFMKKSKQDNYDNLYFVFG
jgi:hypothetical protein